MAEVLWRPFSVTLDAQGSGSAPLGTPSLGYNWQAYITLDSPSQAQVMKVQISGSVLAWGSIQTNDFAVSSGQQVQLYVTGGPASATLNGIMAGVVNEGSAAGLPPSVASDLMTISAGTVNFAPGSTVTIAGTPTVQFAAGQTVDITAGNITITEGSQGGSGVSVQVAPEGPTTIASITGPALSYGNPATLIPAPGAGFKLLIYQVSIFMNTSTSDVGAVTIAFQLTGLVGGSPYLILSPRSASTTSTANTAWTSYHENFDGLPCVASTAFVLVLQNSVTMNNVGGFVFGYVGYRTVAA